jgi:hypothetical protein
MLLQGEYVAFCTGRWPEGVIIELTACILNSRLGLRLWLGLQKRTTKRFFGRQFFSNETCGNRMRMRILISLPPRNDDPLSYIEWRSSLRLSCPLYQLRSNR